MIVGAIATSYALSCSIYHFHLATKFFTFFGKHTIFVMGFDYFSTTIAAKITNIIGVSNCFLIFCVKVITITVGIYLWYWILGFIHNEKIQRMLRY